MATCGIWRRKTGHCGEPATHEVVIGDSEESAAYYRCDKHLEQTVKLAKQRGYPVRVTALLVIESDQRQITITAHDLEQMYISRATFDEMRSALENRIGTLQALDIANTAIIEQLRADLAAARADAERLAKALKMALPYAKEDYYNTETGACPYCDGDGDGDHKPDCKQVSAYWAAKQAISGHNDFLAEHQRGEGEAWKTFFS